MSQAVSAKEMRSVELNSEYLGISALQLMENAGSAVANEIVSRFRPQSRVLILAGVGRNGGDGMVVARHLASMGFRPIVQLIGHESEITDECVKCNWNALREMSSTVELQVSHDSSLVSIPECEVVVDALLGTGTRGTLREPILTAVKRLNETECYRVAVDIPTGIDADTGDILGIAVKANLTVTFHRMKLGLERAKDFTGELKVVEIGVPPESEIHTGPGDVEVVTKRRRPDSHKGDFGRLLVVGGSETYSGAPALVGLAALRAGVDLVHIAAPNKTAHTIASFSPNLITLKLTGEHFSKDNLAQITPVLEKATAVVVGPGLGVHRETLEGVDQLLQLLQEKEKPSLFDADAIKSLRGKRWKAKAPSALTPHAGEFEALTGRIPSVELRSRCEQVRVAAQEIGMTILLKGRVDVVSDGDHVKMNFTGNPGMTVGGTGDVLSGLVGALLAQGAGAFEASSAAAFINGAAGDLVVRELGFHMTSTDIVEQIPLVMMDPMCHKQNRSSRSCSR